MNKRVSDVIEAARQLTSQERDEVVRALLEADGSPTLEGSRLFARIVAEALTPA